MSFTDGMCLGCSARLRREWNLPPLPVAVGRYGLRGELVRVAAMAVMVVGVVLAAGPLDELRIVRTTLAPPQTVLVPPAPVDEEPMPSLAVANVPRRVMPTSISRPLAASYLAVTVVHIPMSPVTEWADTRFPPGIMLASLPHAGLTQQTP